MRIAISQLNLHVGNFAYNRQKIIEAIDLARSQHADIVILPELSVCGYPARDLLYSKAFVGECMDNTRTIAAHCTDIAAITGGPYPNPGKGGKALFNAAFLLYDGKIQHVFRKALLPTYDVFNEYRYFEAACDFHTAEYKGCRLAITVCEDIWNPGTQGMYPIDPPAILAKEKPDLMINISASPFAWDHLGERMALLAENARRHQIPLFACNLVGGQTDLLFDGVSGVFDKHGRLVDTLAQFDEDFKVYDLHELSEKPDIPVPGAPDKEKKCQLILDALTMGLRDYFRKTGMKKAILGLSGGIDSAVTLVIAVRALGKENVWAVLLPGPYSSQHSVDDALTLARKLDVSHDVISIGETVSSLSKSLEPHFKNTSRGTAEENLQARARAVILMGLSNKFGHLLLNTSNKSEAAVGYSTLYGDMSGGLSVIGDVYKTDVYGLAAVINKDKEIIPGNTISKPPSAELKPDQKDTDSLPPYELLDGILLRLLEQNNDVRDIVSEGYDPELVKSVARLIFYSEYKRYQTPPVLRVSKKCLGIGREMPLDGDYEAICKTPGQ